MAGLARSTAYVTQELQGLAELQTGFVQEQIRLAISGGVTDARELLPSQVNALAQVNTVQVAPNFAASVATVDPTDLNFTLPGTGAFNLTAGQGAAITLPNGDVVSKAFRGLAESQAQRFNAVIRTGILSGEPTAQIARRLIGSLDFGDLAKTARQQALAGGELTKMADHQVLTVVRTSVQQVANAASTQVYQANQDITKKYRYVATLDSRTSAICQSLDGRNLNTAEGQSRRFTSTAAARRSRSLTTKGLAFLSLTGERVHHSGPVPKVRSKATSLMASGFAVSPRNIKKKCSAAKPAPRTSESLPINTARKMR
jgi:hypothetical protein